MAVIARSNAGRIASLEDAVQRFTDAQEAARVSEAEQYRKLGVRISILTLVVAAASVCVPIALTIIHAS
jgi:hypothetical protein